MRDLTRRRRWLLPHNLPLTLFLRFTCSYNSATNAILINVTHSAFLSCANYHIFTVLPRTQLENTALQLWMLLQQPAFDFASAREACGRLSIESQFAQIPPCWPHTANQRTRSGHVGGRPHLVLYLHIDAVARMCKMTSSRNLTVILRILARPLSDEGSSKTIPATTKTTFSLATDVSRLWISAWENRLRHWSVSLLAMCRLSCCVLLSPSADVLYFFNMFVAFRKLT